MRLHCFILHLFCILTFNVYQVLCDEDSDGGAYCQGKEVGVYPDVQSNCTKFYICEAVLESSMHWPCLRGTRFDTETCLCQAENNVSCDADPSSSGTECEISTKELVMARAAVTSSKVESSEDPEPTTSENELTTPENKPGLSATSKSCDGKATGLYPNADTGCQSYYACVKGVSYVYEYNCPKFYVFDEGKCQCLPAHLASCVDSSTPCFPSPPPTKPTTTLPPPPPPSDFCRGKGPGYYTDVHRDCEWYFVCFGGAFQTYQFQCPSHLRFNHFTCNCDYPYAVQCTIFNEVPCFPPQSGKALL